MKTNLDNPSTKLKGRASGNPPATVSRRSARTCPVEVVQTGLKQGEEKLAVAPAHSRSKPRKPEVVSSEEKKEPNHAVVKETLMSAQSSIKPDVKPEIHTSEQASEAS